MRTEAIPPTAQYDGEVSQLLDLEAKRQAGTIDLIASENHVSSAILEAQGSLATDKYAEGYPERRYYSGCIYMDAIENYLMPSMPMFNRIVVARLTWLSI